MEKNNCKICSKEINQLQGRNRTRCNACNTKIRRYRCKIKAIELLGGKCSRCGYDNHPAPLEFHHIDPSKKSFNIGMVANKSWKVIVKELKKCILLCANCHRIEHSERYDNDFVEHAKKYKSPSDRSGDIVTD